MEFMIINGERVQIPQAVVSAGRDAVAAWAAAQAAPSAPPSPSPSARSARQE